jgi:hypothetical protein
VVNWLEEGFLRWANQKKAQHWLLFSGCNSPKAQQVLDFWTNLGQLPNKSKSASLGDLAQHKKTDLGLVLALEAVLSHLPSKFREDKEFAAFLGNELEERLAFARPKPLVFGEGTLAPASVEKEIMAAYKVKPGDYSPVSAQLTTRIYKKQEWVPGDQTKNTKAGYETVDRPATVLVLAHERGKIQMGLDVATDPSILKKLRGLVGKRLPLVLNLGEDKAKKVAMAKYLAYQMWDWNKPVGLGSPKVLSWHGYSFSFYANDHEPPHVHVTGHGAAAIFFIDPVGLRENYGYNSSQLGKISLILQENQMEILQKWRSFFNN